MAEEILEVAEQNNTAKPGGSARFALPQDMDQLLAQAVQKSLEQTDLIEDQKTAIRQILHCNLTSERIFRYLGKQSIDSTTLFAYVSAVIQYYLLENPCLLSLQAGCPDTWLKLVNWLNRCAYVKLDRLGLLNLLDDNISDFGQEISLWLVEKFSRLASPSPNSPSAGLAIGYPYDVPFEPWIAKVQTYRILTFARHHWRHGNTEAIVQHDELVVTGDDITVVLERLMLNQELTQLTPHQRKVITDIFVHDMDVNETAQHLGCTRKAVYHRKEHAINRLRARLEQQEQVFALANTSLQS